VSQVIPGDYLELKADGSFSFKNGGFIFSGRCQEKGDKAVILWQDQKEWRWTWRRIESHNVIDPDTKYWEKYEDDVSLPGLYLRLKLEHLLDNPEIVGDYLELSANKGFDLEEKGVKLGGTWADGSDGTIVFVANVDLLVDATVEGGRIITIGGVSWIKKSA